MSEMINNREYRKKVLKELILELHDGKSAEEVKERFRKLIEGISPSEISAMEQSLIMEGMPVEEVQRLCDVHAEIFKGSIREIHHPDEIPGHPVHTFKLENREIEKVIQERVHLHLEEFKQEDSKENILKLIEDFNLLWDIDKHYSRKENLLFPYLEKYGITAPPKVMWGVDDEIRSDLKKVKSHLLNYDGNKEEMVQNIEELMTKIKEMIFKEENILFPMSLETLTVNEWFKIAEESDEIGYCITEPKEKWKPDKMNEEEEVSSEEEEFSKGFVKFGTGILTPKEINGILNHLPVDITFIDKDDVVRYFSQGKERIFARTKAVIGRNVRNCHPPGSVHVVEKLLEDLKSGKKDHEDFWIKMRDMYVYIRYFAVRDGNGEYLGTLEVTQNIKPIQQLQGEKRLLSE